MKKVESYTWVFQTLSSLLATAAQSKHGAASVKWSQSQAFQPASRTKRLGSVVSVRVWLGVSVGYIERRAKKHSRMRGDGR